MLPLPRGDSSYHILCDFWIEFIYSSPMDVSYERISIKSFIFALARCPGGTIFLHQYLSWEVLYHIFKFRLYMESCHGHRASVFH